MFGTDCQTRSCVFCTAVLCVLCSNYWTGAVTDKTSQRRDSSPPRFAGGSDFRLTTAAGSGGLSIPSVAWGLGDDGMGRATHPPSIICAAIEVPKSAMPHNKPLTPLLHSACPSHTSPLAALPTLPTLRESSCGAGCAVRAACRGLHSLAMALP